MITPVPPWLLTRYARIILRIGYRPFKLGEADRIFEGKKPSAALVLSRLRRTGWVDYLGRETYRVVHPIVCMMEASGYQWRDRIIQRDRLPCIELAAARIIEEFGERLVALVLFGSVARGTAKPESDIDLLLVAEGLPDRYSDRVKIVQSLLSWRPLEKWLLHLWHERGIYPNLQVIPIAPKEAEVIHPFYLDMVDEGVFIYDRDSFMGRRLAAVREKLGLIGASKVTLPDGGWYWILTPDASRARELVL